MNPKWMMCCSLRNAGNVPEGLVICPYHQGMIMARIHHRVIPLKLVVVTVPTIAISLAQIVIIRPSIVILNMSNFPINR